jgi:hypothetical protein
VLHPLRQRRRPALPEGGIDGGDLDGGDVDGGPDGGDPDACVPSETAERTCRGGGDEDCDGLVDCDDLDCAGAVDCCANGVSDEIRWAGTVDGARFAAIPDTVDLGDFRIGSQGGTPYLVEFPSRLSTRAIWSRSCTALAFGASIDTSFRVDAECTGDPCDFAALVLTPSEAFNEDEELQRELAVRLDSRGNLVLERTGEGALVPVARLVGAGPFEVQVDIEPSTEMGQAVLRVSVTVDGDRLLDAAPLWLAEDLVLWGQRCRALGATDPGADGLFVAVEGVGDDVWVGPLTLTERECANPSVFRRTDLEGGLEGGLRLDPAWSGGGVGAPTLTSYRAEAGGTPTWEVWVDGADRERLDEVFDPPIFAIGGAQTQAEGGLAGFLPRRGEGVGMARVGQELLGGEGETHGSPAFVEPHLLAIRDEADIVESLRVVYAAEDPEGNPPDGMDAGGPVPLPLRRFDLYRTSADPSLIDNDVSATADPILTLEDAAISGEEPCRQLRDPALTLRTDAPSDGYWLFYRCVQPDGRGRLDAVRLNASFLPMAEPAVLLRPDDAPYARGGLASPAPILELRDGGAAQVLRLWFLADDGGETAVAYAQGRGAVADGLPELQLYPANPILRAGDVPLGACGDCAIRSVAASIDVERPREVRLLVARSRTVGETTAHEILVTEQIRPDD